ncbi:MAG: hypothetical protein GY906_23300 [bacterium]|nr:hypothetical protein [bacterium]
MPDYKYTANLPLDSIGGNFRILQLFNNVGDGVDLFFLGFNRYTGGGNGLVFRFDQGALPSVPIDPDLSDAISIGSPLHPPPVSLLTAAAEPVLPLGFAQFTKDQLKHPWIQFPQAITIPSGWGVSLIDGNKNKKCQYTISWIERRPG